MKRRTRLTIAIFTAVSCWLLFSFTSEIYMYTDNVGVAVILDGYYSNPLSQYQHPLFCLSVNFLARLFPFADMYTVTVHILIFLELFAIMFLTLNWLSSRSTNDGASELSTRVSITSTVEGEFVRSWKEWDLHDYLILTVSVLLCIFLSAGLNIWRANYTIQAGSMLFVGWSILTYEKKSKMWYVVGIILVASGYMIRKEAGLLFIPFVVLLLLTESIQQENWNKETTDFSKTKGNRGYILHHYLPVIFIVILLFSSQTAITFFEPYKSANRYNKARTDLVDFPVKSWDAEDMAYINRQDYVAATNWLFSDTEIMNTEYLVQMAEVGSRNQFPYTFTGLRTVLYEMMTIAWRTDVYMSVMVVLCIMLAAWNLLFQRSIWIKIISICTIVGAFMILLYFTFRGRAPLRVWQPVLFGVMMVELAVIMHGQVWLGKTMRTVGLFLLIVPIYYSAGQVVAHTEFHGFRTALMARIDTNDSAYVATFSENALYIWPNWHTTIPEYFGNMGKLPTQRVLEHNIALGDWSSGQPYFTDFLERIGHPNPIKDLVDGKNTYIMSNSDYVLDFLRFHYGEDIELVEYRPVNETTAYRVKRGTENE